MPVCPRCGVAFIDGEDHACSRDMQRQHSTPWLVVLAFVAFVVVLFRLIVLFFEP
jgi:hypothetical protein